MFKVIKYVMVDILRSRVALAYTLFLLAISLSIFNLEDNSGKGLLSMLNIVLIIVPLVSLVFSTIYMYNSSEFIELLLSQPIQRKKLLLSLYLGICLSMMIAFAAGAGIPTILLKLDISAMMGYTGAIFNQFFGAVSGIMYSASIMLLWMLVPLFVALRKFKVKDL